MNPRNLIFILIGVICLISIVFTLYSELYYPSTPASDTTTSISETGTINEYDLTSNFGTIFLNKLNTQNNNISNITKKDYTKDLVYTSYEINENIPNQYSINAKIPSININQANILAINNEIESKFKSEISNTITSSSSDSNKLYDVEYMAYINSNILSLVIKATKKDGNSAQRVIVKTYNYNLASNELLSLEQILSLKSVSKTYAKKKIKETITKANVSSQSLKDLGYSVYMRNLDSNIYEIENTSTFFIGENGVLYVLYPYGNSNLTSEMDIIVF